MTNWTIILLSQSFVNIFYFCFRATTTRGLRLHSHRERPLCFWWLLTDWHSTVCHFIMESTFQNFLIVKISYLLWWPHHFYFPNQRKVFVFRYNTDPFLTLHSSVVVLNNVWRHEKKPVSAPGRSGSDALTNWTMNSLTEHLNL